MSTDQVDPTVMAEMRAYSEQLAITDEGRATAAGRTDEEVLEFLDSFYEGGAEGFRGRSVVRSVEDWEADPGQDAALDAAYAAGPTQPSAAAVILAELHGDRTFESVAVLA